MTSNTQKLNEVLFNTWDELLKSDLKGNKGYFEKELNDLRNGLSKKNPSLNKLNRGLEKLLDNGFFRESVGGCYKKHQQKLAEIRKELRDIITQKKKFKKDFRNGYYEFFMFLSGAENCAPNPESAPSRIVLDDFTEHYSNEVFLNNFCIPPLKNAVDDIYDEVTSEAFLDKYLEELYGKLSRELKLEIYSVERINGLLKEILIELLKKGFVKKDLSLNSTSKSQTPSLDSQLQKLDDMIRGSTSKWAVIVSMDNIEFKGVNEYKIGKVEFYDKNAYDCSKLIDAISTLPYKTEEVKNKDKSRIINFFKDKIIVEIEVNAYGINGAEEKGFLEISKVIDGLSLWEGDVMIQEPKFEKIYEFILLNRESGKLFLRWNRDPRHVWKVKLDETTKDFLKDFDPIFNKSYNAFTELEKSVANALHWYRKGNMSVYSSDKFLDYIIALESLLTTEEDGRSGKQKIISDRAIDAIWILDEYRKTFESRIRKMYDHRSEIVHEASIEVPNLENETEELGNITRRVICGVASKLDKCDTLKQFLKLNAEEINNKRDHELENARKLGLKIDKTIKGEGQLKKKSGEYVGKIDFEFRIKDDEKFVTIEGNIYGFEGIKGSPLSLSLSDEFGIEGKLDNVEGKLVVKEMGLYDTIFGLFDIAHKKQMRFRVFSFDIIKPSRQL
uniref:Uncharacterized protein n=1 Tax=Candidatus Methanogaster sp. ANME-2c ERB4 TaxID=2759911 RepID=A0A7G9YME6_9EURY|nr:hypothetical protein CDCKMDEO_00025 [Methanosarcinales archaeon ANME-2c ERB4]